MKIRRADDRGHTELDWLDSRHSFSFDMYYDPQHTHFGPLRVINEDIVQPGQGFGKHSHREMEILTYVIEGGLQHSDSLGNGSIIRAGEIQRISAGTGIEHSEFNAAQDKPVHFLQIWIIPWNKVIEPSYQQVHIKTGSGWQLIASIEKHPHAVLINQDVSLHMAKAKAGEKLSLQLSSGRLAWLQLVKGKVLLEGQTATAGDGISLDKPAETALEIKENAEILFFDLPSSF